MRTAYVNLTLSLANLVCASLNVHLGNYGWATFHSGLALLCGAIFLIVTILND